MSRWIVLAMLLPLAGCQLFGFVGANFLPVEKIKPVYKPIDQKTLVFIDDPRHAAPSPTLLAIVAETAAEQLRREKVIAEFVPHSQLEDLRTSSEDFESLPIDRIGERLGAQQVIYVLIDGFDSGGDRQELQRPTASARLKVVDVGTGKRLFPALGEHGVGSSLPFEQPPLDSESHGRQTAIARRLAQRLGEDIARQFHDHKPREVGSGFKD